MSETIFKDEKTDIGRNIRFMREIRSWTQSELARRAGVSRTTIRRVEEGMPCWNLTLDRLASVFNIPAYEFCITNRFANVLNEETDYVVHHSEQYFWHARGDRRNTIPEDNESAIQNPAERQRLGQLGFVPMFKSWLEFLLPVGPGILRMELYGQHEQRFMPQYSAISLFVLSGNILITIAGKPEQLAPGDAIAFDSLKSVLLQPLEKYAGGPPCELLLVGSQRRKVN